MLLITLRNGKLLSSYDFLFWTILPREIKIAELGDNLDFLCIKVQTFLKHVDHLKMYLIIERRKNFFS